MSEEPDTDTVEVLYLLHETNYNYNDRGMFYQPMTLQNTQLLGVYTTCCHQLATLMDHNLQLNTG